ncbi:MAG TPA: hypothetical protein VGZ22_00380 [Isosphaeraceae bacterium]|jgi:hypothetical protein|nr:hypothetical protein [Isosphaeraceae bacterium]
MRRNAGRVYMGIALGCVLVGWSWPAGAQGLGAAAGTGVATPGAPGMLPGAASGSTVNPYANPFSNPYMNPYMNPWMTQYPTTGNGSNTLLYFMAAQRAAGGLGSPYAPGGSASMMGGALGNPAAGPLGSPVAGAPSGVRSGGAGNATNGGIGPQRGASSGVRRRVTGQGNPPGGPGQNPAGQLQPSRPGSGGRVPGRFDDNPYVDDRRGLLSSRYAAYGASMTTQDGQPMVPGSAPAPNEGVRRYFNHYPSYNR